MLRWLGVKVGREIPSRIGRYEVLRPLGSGGMATVWLARYRVVGSVHRQVAIKAMHPHLRGDPDWLDAFLREARLAATIQHPNVVSVEEVIDDPEGLFLVMEFVAGPTVAEILGSERELPPPIAGRLILDALEGLHAVHELADDRGRELGIVHRDFTPQNILVGGDGIGKLTDFGVAKMITEATTGSVKGKLGYMAPEQLAGKTLDRRADLWAAAVVTWELIAKRRMFGHRGQVAVVPQLTEEHFPLAQHHPSAPPALDELLKRALSPTRDERFATVQAMAQQLQRLWKRTWGIASHSDVAGWLSALPGAETYAYLATAVTDRGRPPAPTPLEAFGYGPRAAAALIAVGALMALGAFTVTRSPDVALATRRGSRRSRRWWRSTRGCSCWRTKSTSTSSTPPPGTSRSRPCPACASARSR